MRKLDQLVKAEELAELLGVNQQTVWKWRRAGKIPSVPLGNGQYRFREDEVLESLKKLETKKGEKK